MAETQEQTGNRVAYVCSRCAGNIPAADRLWLKPVFCIGQVSAGQILQLIAQGAEQVLVIGCPAENCRHERGPEIARSQVAIARGLLELLGFDRTAVGYFNGDDELKNSVALEFFSPVKKEEMEQEEAAQPASFAVPADFTAAEFVCLDCGRCSGICPVARTGLGFSPRRLIKQALTAGKELSSRAVYSCLGCDLCTTVCPSGKSISRTVQRLRVIAFNNRVQPALAHSGVMQMVGRIMARGTRKQRRSGWISPELKVTDQGDTALFTGCLPYFDVLFGELGINSVPTVRNAVRCLNQVGIVPVVLDDERCCGHDLLWLGDVSSARRLAEHNLVQLHNAGVRRVIFLCPECQYTFQYDYPQLAGKTGLELMHISQVLEAGGFQPGASGAAKRRVTYHDPCRLGRQLGIYEPPRRLITAIPDVELREMGHNRQQALCCGGTSWLECGATVKLLQERRLAEARAVDAELLVTACTKCEIHLRCALTRTALRPVPIINLIDLIAGGDKIGSVEQR